MNNFKEHFKKYNQWYSFGFFLILTLIIVLLFLKVESLDNDVDKYVNTPSFDHQLTKDEFLKKQAKEQNVAPLNVVAPDGTMPGQVPGMPAPDGTQPANALPNGAVMPQGTEMPTPPLPPAPTGVNQ